MRGRLLSFSLSVMVLGSLTLTSTANILPVAGHLCLPDVQGCSHDLLLQWSPQLFNAKFYAKSVPLAQRQRLNTHAGNMIPYFGFDDSNTAAQIEFGHHVPQEMNWQYLQSMVYFGGSQSGGQVIVPTPGWIHAAHQNGVKISGTIFFSPPVFGGDKEYQAFADMITPGALQTKIAQALAKLADTYGFDGWFINEEVQGMNAYQKKGMQSFIHQVHLADPSLVVTWYDDSDPWTFLNGGIDDILQDPHEQGMVYNPVFINYGWGDPQQYVSAAQRIGYPTTSIHYGIDVPDGRVWDWSSQKRYFDQVMPSPDVAYGALTEWDYMTLISKTANSKVDNNQSLNTLNQNERDLWLNAQQPDESGGSHVVAWFTSVTQLPFNTFFNTGQGNDYFISGEAQHVGAWHDIGQQDVLPTWQFKWQTTNPEDAVKISYDYADAYTGSSSLLVKASMKVGEQIDVPLYRSDLKLSQDILRVVSQLNASKVDASVCLSSTKKTQCYPLMAGDHWKATTIDLSDWNNQTAQKISLRLQAKKVAHDVRLNLGQLYIGPSQKNTSTWHDIAATVTRCKPGLDCVQWQSQKNVVNYYVFDRASHRFVGATHQAILAVPTNANTVGDYQVQAVAVDGAIS